MLTGLMSQTSTAQCVTLTSNPTEGSPEYNSTSPSAQMCVCVCVCV